MLLGEYIRRYREEHDLSQRKFAQMCGLSNGYISMIEKGENPSTKKPITPTIAQIKKIATAMGVTAMEMLDVVDDMPISLADDQEWLAKVEDTKQSEAVKAIIDLCKEDPKLAEDLLYLARRIKAK